MRCLLIEDQSPLKEYVRDRLMKEGYVVDTGADCQDALCLASDHSYDVIVLNLILSHAEELSIIKALRTLKSSMAILIIGAVDSFENRVSALNAGADDYLVEPFELVELVAKVGALVRRLYHHKSPVITVADMTINSSQKKVIRGGSEILLTRKEYHLLEYLIFRQGEPVSREEIRRHVYAGRIGGSNAVDVYIGYLRKKLNEGGGADLIQTRRGHGYMISAFPSQ